MADMNCNVLKAQMADLVFVSGVQPSGLTPNGYPGSSPVLSAVISTKEQTLSAASTPTSPPKGYSSSAESDEQRIVSPVLANPTAYNAYSCTFARMQLTLCHSLTTASATIVSTSSLSRKSNTVGSVSPEAADGKLPVSSGARPAFVSIIDEFDLNLALYVCLHASAARSVVAIYSSFRVARGLIR